MNKIKGVNRNVVTTLSHRECKDVLLNKKYLRHSMNRIPSKETIKTSLFCFDDKLYILNNGYDELEWISW